MARTTLNKTTLNSAYPALPITALSADLNFQAATGSAGSNGNQFAWGDAARLLLIAINTGITGRTVTISSIANSNTHNRSGDITAYAVAIGALASPIASAWIIERTGFYQADGMLYLEANHAEIKFACVAI
jgi:hypothetical protein